MTDKPLIAERDGAVAILRLNRPAGGNTIDLALARALEQEVLVLADDASVRAILLTGEGRLFCGGGDIAAFASAGEDAPAFLFELADTLHRSVDLLAGMQKPLVVAVNGPAAGAGFSLAIAGDIVLAAPSAHFTAAYAGVGLTPDGGMSWLLPRLVGLRRAQDIILNNRRVDAAEAVAIGLVSRIADEGKLMEEALATAAHLAEGPVAAIGGARTLLAASATRSLKEQLDAEARRISEAAGGAEAQEGIAAFLARRKPRFIEGRDH
ncbi:enoyl-CoA hydratase/isomerase family protein [Sphingopyxis sp. JAI128]|uniref:enoyl-CoA hydratase/isomerase family protein n=1 Tax=Sphingopyxis sp. JAI128 TaxID=2723066 RepID=UPI00160FC6E2|nr:enoyl-CoA hydratase-related protein [Sphingopyxis sp. JAI128]MBB6426872.1 2-(1,2-epoxy-1,2-dihydrophenyl)acetyl-CoA isomerase [Sphingopyxis sp. JAI128]